jgi:hypothetical protein
MYIISSYLTNTPVKIIHKSYLCHSSLQIEPHGDVHLQAFKDIYVGIWQKVGHKKSINKTALSFFRKDPLKVVNTKLCLRKGREK